MASITRFLLAALHLAPSHKSENDAASIGIKQWAKITPDVIDSMAAASWTLTPTNAGLLPVDAPDSAALFLYGPSAQNPSLDGEVFFLPLGMRVYTDENRALPAHPQYAQLVSNSLESTADSRHIECFAYPYVKDDVSAFRVQGNALELQQNEGRAIRFGLDDLLVDFVTPTSEWALNGQQIESYECRR